MSERKKVSRLHRMVLAGLAALAVAITPLLVAPAPAEAAPVTGFNAGNIISDSLFYDGSAMTASQVQTFLNQRLSSCRIGTAPYLPGALSPSGSGNIIASACLKSFKQTTSSRAADAYCSGYVGTANETAAQIITKVGKACGISQKVLLVMLEKEQSLLTDSWPVTRQYNYALGMNCPDNGPGNSANCDAASAGFALQLYLGARQLKVYKGNPNSFNYKPFQTNTIQWHPNSSCGTSRVYIENWATAALYIYTPYRPNQAALNAGWGTGDACSSYGNRNFYNFYKSWFGSTSGGPDYPISGATLAYWNTNKSWLGQPTGGAVKVAANGGGTLQYFVGGFVYEMTNGKAVGFTKTSPLISAFGNAGGIEGTWGWPLSPAVSHGSGNSTVLFQGGVVVEKAGVGVYLVPEMSRLAWESSGGFTGSLGYPTANAVSVAGGATQAFQDGRMYSSSSGAFALPNGVISEAYVASGGPGGPWGWPRGRLLCAVDGSTCTMDFLAGVATWTAVRGTIFTPLGSLQPTLPTTPGSGEKIVGGAA